MRVWLPWSVVSWGRQIQSEKQHFVSQTLLWFLPLWFKFKFGKEESSGGRSRLLFKYKAVLALIKITGHTRTPGAVYVYVIYPHVQCRDIFPLDLTQLSGLFCLVLFPACLVPQGGLHKVLSTSPLGLLRRSCAAPAAPGRGRGDRSSSCPPLLAAPWPR